MTMRFLASMKAINVVVMAVKALCALMKAFLNVHVLLETAHVHHVRLQPRFVMNAHLVWRYNHDNIQNSGW